MYEFLLLFGIVFWAAVVFAYIRSGAASVYHPVTYYLLVHFLIFTLRPILAYYYQYDKLYYLYGFHPTMEEKSIVLAGADLALLVFSAVCLRIAHRPFTWGAEVPSRATRTRLQSAFVIVALICLPLGGYSLLQILRGNGGEMAIDSATGSTINVTGNGYLSDAQLIVGPTCVLIAWIFRFRLVSLIPFLLYSAAKLSTGGRGPFVAAAFSLGLFYLIEQRRRWPTVRVLAGVAIVVALFTVVGTNRMAVNAVIFGGSSVGSVDLSHRDRFLESMDYGNMEFNEYLVHVIPGKTGTYDYFADNLEVFTAPIPRVLWKDKPVGSPVQPYSLFDFGNPIGMTMSIPGEGWAHA